jgi:CheY-like chemotaxis protein
LKQILADTDDLVVVGEAANGSEVMQKVREQDCAVLVLDISMPGRSGVDLIHMIKAEKPELPILILSMHHEEQYAVRALHAGAKLSDQGELRRRAGGRHPARGRWRSAHQRESDGTDGARHWAQYGASAT